MVSGITAVVVVIVGGIITLSVTGGSGHKAASKRTSTTASPPTTASPTTTPKPKAASSSTFSIARTLLQEVEGVPVATLVAAAEKDGSSVTRPEKLASSAPKLSVGAKPEVLYLGTEWCPFCAAERWSLVMALSKFGTFGPLRGTTSSSADTNASSPTFTFYHADFTSKYIAFVAIEEQTNTGQQLQAPTAAESALESKFDSAGSIPFIYMGGKYLVIGSQYPSPALSNMAFSKAASYLTSGANATSKGAEAAAGYLVANICALTHGQPVPVCSQVPASLQGASSSS